MRQILNTKRLKELIKAHVINKVLSVKGAYDNLVRF